MKHASGTRPVNTTRSLGIICALIIMISVVARDGVAAAPTQKKTHFSPSSAEVFEAQHLLNELGYWIGEVDGEWEADSRHALIAFQKVERRVRTGQLTPEELKALRVALRPEPIEGGNPHVEIDLSRQVLFVVDAEGVVTKILSVSTGNGDRFFDHGEWHLANTPRGRFTVQWKVDGWRRSTLGLLYYPNYFSGGFAIHGSLSVPMHPASHGCVRIPMFAAKEFSEMTPVGMEVIIHDGG